MSCLQVPQWPNVEDVIFQESTPDKSSLILLFCTIKLLVLHLAEKTKLLPCPRILFIDVFQMFFIVILQVPQFIRL